MILDWPPALALFNFVAAFPPRECFESDLGFRPPPIPFDLRHSAGFRYRKGTLTRPLVTATLMPCLKRSSCRHEGKLVRKTQKLRRRQTIDPRCTIPARAYVI